jgi:hypothetical protein
MFARVLTTLRSNQKIGSNPGLCLVLVTIFLPVVVKGVEIFYKHQDILETIFHHSSCL